MYKIMVYKRVYHKKIVVTIERTGINLVTASVFFVILCFVYGIQNEQSLCFSYAEYSVVVKEMLVIR